MDSESDLKLLLLVRVPDAFLRFSSGSCGILRGWLKYAAIVGEKKFCLRQQNTKPHSKLTLERSTALCRQRVSQTCRSGWGGR